MGRGSLQVCGSCGFSSPYSGALGSFPSASPPLLAPGAWALSATSALQHGMPKPGLWEYLLGPPPRPKLRWGTLEAPLPPEPFHPGLGDGKAGVLGG